MTETPPEQPAPRVWVSRRKLVQSAAFGGAVLTALQSRPVLGWTTSGGGDGTCTFSGWLSGNISGPGFPDSCGGKSPGYYMNSNSLGDWAASGYHPGITSTQANWGTGSPLPDALPASLGGVQILGNPNTKFSAAFGVAPPLGGSPMPPITGWSAITMMECLRSLNGSLEFHAVASLLNAALGFVPGLTTADVIALYIAGAITGNYKGFLVTPEIVKDFFESTYH